MLEALFNIDYIDHYAVIVRDLEKSRDFHIKSLGFSVKNTYELQTSEQAIGNDTVAIVLTKEYADRTAICVINQPLNVHSLLNRHIREHGEGIHHIAYSVKNIECEFDKGLNNHIDFTSNKIIFDPVNRLKQIFIDKKYTGYFIELIQRDNLSSEDIALFSSHNIRELIMGTV